MVAIGELENGSQAGCCKQQPVVDRRISKHSTWSSRRQTNRDSRPPVVMLSPFFSPPVGPDPSPVPVMLDNLGMAE